MTEEITLAQYLKLTAPKNKYFAKKTERDGFWFDSKNEADRYSELKIEQRFGYIRDLVLQPRFRLIVNKQLICTYVADFSYYDAVKKKTVVEDVKSDPTRKKRDYRIKKKLFEALYEMTLTEV